MNKTNILFYITLIIVLLAGMFCGKLINRAFSQELTIYQYDGGVLLRKDKTDANGNIEFAFSPNATSIYMLWDGKGKWIKGGDGQEPPAQAILDRHEAKKPLNGGKKPVITQLKEAAQKQKRRKVIEKGDIVLYLPTRVLAEVIDIKDKAYRLKLMPEEFNAKEADIWDGNVVWMEVGNLKLMPQFINSADGTLLYGDQEEWDKQPKKLKELPPRRKPDAIIRNR